MWKAEWAQEGTGTGSAGMHAKCRLDKPGQSPFHQALRSKAL